ncbi:hypothetical protein QAD02_006275 [Eretmocerus hayati]|uniref:Uncharacterized protein n=1 Tax=Eretmocerus hayati TaxID=131215 RepID=A0ACC2N0H7_9HYME|nr:hypothetical protein QAD02_006275 [Eretmocerus hayati]
MLKLILLSHLISILCIKSSDDHEPRVKTPLGIIKGYHKVSEYGRLYEAYEGIPYALPPLRELRFEPPQPVTPWLGELQATKVSHECLQYNHLPSYVQGNRVIGSEDCLYLNVYVPDRENEIPSHSMPVIFWIHGGAFMFGSGILYGPKFFMDHDVILVTINYRIGPLGFLSTEDEIVPGNMGLKDQNMALRWVRDNIEYFSGDPNKITLIGCSAGGASVHYHYFSPLSASLFHNGISMSGTALNSWTQTEASLEKAKKLADLMGCPSGNTKDMIKCLRYRPAVPMIQAVKEFLPWLYNPFSPFGPVIEKSGMKPFISRSPIEMLESKDVMDVPWITSVTSHEGLYPAADFIANEELLKYLDENWNILAPHLLDYNYSVPQQSQASLNEKIRMHYLGKNPINKSSRDQITKMLSDRLFVVDAERAARLQAMANKSPTWFYYYSYRGDSSLSDLYSGTNENFGVSHADDALLIFDTEFFKSSSVKDQLVRDMLLRAIVSFAENGEDRVLPVWEKVDHLDEKFKYLHIKEPNEVKMESEMNFGDKNFWDSILMTGDKMSSNHFKDEL